MRDKLLNFDKFPHPFFFTLPSGKDSLPSACGLFCTIVLFIMLTFYGVTQLITLHAYGNTDVLVNLIDSYYDDSYVFDLDNSETGSL